MKCEIIKDLFPSYIDHLTSPESNLEIEEHLQNCSQCRETLAQMKEEVSMEEPLYDKKKINPFKKLNRKILQSVMITLTVCALLVGSYFYFFGIGWKVNSNNMKITYSCEEDAIIFDFELTDDKVLTMWHIRRNHEDYAGPEMVVRECFESILDDRGEYPNQFSYGIHCLDEDGNLKPFMKEETITLHYKDKTETIYLKDVAKELGIEISQPNEPKK